MNIDDLRALTLAVCKYRLDNNLSYADFYLLAGISGDDLVNLQLGNYSVLPAGVVEKVEAVVYDKEV